jgi:hypothetical protein
MAPYLSARLMCKANVGDFVVEPHKPSTTSRAMGILLFELIEPGSYALDPKTVKIRDWKPWNDQIKDFLAQTLIRDPSSLVSVSQYFQGDDQV